MRDKKYLSFSLFGDNPFYTIGAVRNAELYAQIYPSWQMVVYHDQQVPANILKQLSVHNVELVSINEHEAHPSFWRFFVLDREDCERAIFRDADSRLTEREALAVEEWIRDDTTIHVMRDHPYHKIPFGTDQMAILAGMWGMKGGIIEVEKQVSSFLEGITDQSYGIDQSFLANLYNRHVDDMTVHDEFYSQKPFPSKRTGLHFVGERIDENEQSIGDDWKPIADFYKNNSKCAYTIIIPTFNSAKTITVCIESVLQQDFKDFEVIVQDGGSNDDTIFIISNYNDPRVSIYQATDSGVYDAMNKALDKSAGEWVFFLGSDDLLFRDNVLSQAHSYLSKTTSKFVYGDVLMVKPNKPEEDGQVYLGEMSDKKVFENNICHQAIFYHKSIFASGYRYNLDYKLYADWDANLYLSTIHKRKYIPLIVSRFNLGGLSSTDLDENFKKDKWLNIVRYFGFKLSDKEYRIYKRQIREASKQFRKDGNIFYSVKAYAIFLALKIRKIF